jgi:KUP system potassium uptake protein
VRSNTGHILRGLAAPANELMLRSIPRPTQESAHRSRNRAALVLGALGVVYGDIGTSPLYAVNEIFFGHGRVAPTAVNTCGCISLVVWSLIIVVAVKYVLLVLRADNDGEGGVFALYGLLHRYKDRGLKALLVALMLAAGLLFGDGVITPAISVLSAVEGLNVATPMFEHAIVPITVVILTLLFAIQSKGTERVGRVFGPILVIWFVAIAALGLKQIWAHTGILQAFDPRWGARFLWTSGPRASLRVLGSVMLTVTGGEALYADMGHFGKGAIRLGWFTLVFPSLLLNYLGQGAFLSSGAPVLGGNLFFSTVPAALVLPMVGLSTLATIIASQALISGAFSLASQGIGLGLLPRLRIRHTHHAHEGQIYVPFVNWALYLGCTLLVLTFRSNSALASAYGLAVSGVMVATALAMVPLARRVWRWRWSAAVGVFGLFGIVDATFLLANSFKFLEGGFVPLSIGVAIFVVMTTWRWGRKATFAAYSSKHTMTVDQLIEWKRGQTTFLERNAILMVPKPLRSGTDNTPALLQLFLDRYGLLPENLLFIEVVHAKTPYVRDGRYRVTVFQKDEGKGSIVSVTIKFGFLEDPNVEHILAELAGHREIDLPSDPHRWIVHVSLENLIPARDTGAVDQLRLKLFSILRRISQPMYYAYGLGNEVQLSAEIMPVKLG